MTLWTYVANTASGLTKIPRTHVDRIYARTMPAWVPYLGPKHPREVSYLQVVLGVEHRRVIRVISVLPYRMLLDEAGLYDERANGRRAAERVGLMHRTDPAAALERLQADASYFWALSDRQWRELAESTGRPMEELHAASLWVLASR